MIRNSRKRPIRASGSAGATFGRGTRSGLQHAKLAEEATTREWMARVGMRLGLERTAHLPCEHLERLGSIGRISGGQLELSSTQVDLADTLGLPSVHVNRMLQTLRRDRLISLKGHRLRIFALRRLHERSEFETGYLERPPGCTLVTVVIGGTHACGRRDQDCLGQSVSAERLHDPGSVDLNRARAQIQLPGNSLIGAASEQTLKYFALAWGKHCSPATGLVVSAHAISLRVELGERRSDREQQSLRRPGSLKEIDRSRLHDTNPEADIA